MNAIIESERIILREIEVEDAKSLLEYMQEPKIKDFISLPNQLETLREYIEKVKTKNERITRWVIIKKDDQKIIWSIVLRWFSKKHKKTDIWYRIGEKYEWKWYMTEILKALIKYLIDEEAVERIEAWIRIDNNASIKLVEKLWFEKEWRARNFIKRWDRFYDFLLYGLLKEDFQKRFTE